jgi:hypothetical protein
VSLGARLGCAARVADVFAELSTTVSLQLGGSVIVRTIERQLVGVQVRDAGPGIPTDIRATRWTFVTTKGGSCRVGADHSSGGPARQTLNVRARADGGLDPIVMPQYAGTPEGDVAPSKAARCCSSRSCANAGAGFRDAVPAIWAADTRETVWAFDPPSVVLSDRFSGVEASADRHGDVRRPLRTGRACSSREGAVA